MDDHQELRFTNFIKNNVYISQLYERKHLYASESLVMCVIDYLLNIQAYIAIYDPKVNIDKIHIDLNYLGCRVSILNENGLFLSILKMPLLVFMLLLL